MEHDRVRHSPDAQRIDSKVEQGLPSAITLKGDPTTREPRRLSLRSARRSTGVTRDLIAGGTIALGIGALGWLDIATARAPDAADASIREFGTLLSVLFGLAAAVWWNQSAKLSNKLVDEEAPARQSQRDANTLNGAAATFTAAALLCSVFASSPWRSTSSWLCVSPVGILLEGAMRASVIALSAFLLLCAGQLSPIGAQIATTQGDSGDLVSAGAQIPVDIMRLSRGIADFAQHLGMLFAPRAPEFRDPQLSSSAPTQYVDHDRAVSELRRYPE